METAAKRSGEAHHLNISMGEFLDVFSICARYQAHINVLEVRVVFNYLRFRAQQLCLMPARILMFLDSQVALSVIAKGRSSSLQLNNLLRRIAGLSTLCGFRLYLGWAIY